MCHLKLPHTIENTLLGCIPFVFIRDPEQHEVSNKYSVNIIYDVMAMIITDGENHNYSHWQNGYNYTKTKVTFFFNTLRSPFI